MSENRIVKLDRDNIPIGRRHTGRPWSRWNDNADPVREAEQKKEQARSLGWKKEEVTSSIKETAQNIQNSPTAAHPFSCCLPTDKRYSETHTHTLYSNSRVIITIHVFGKTPVATESA